MRFAGYGAAVAGAVGAVVLLAACSGGTGRGTGSGGGGGAGGGNAAAGGTINVVMAKYSDRTQPYWTGLVSRFEKQYPKIHVRLQVIDWTTLLQRAPTMIRAKDYPDVLNFNMYNTFADSGLLRPATQVLAPSVAADFIPAFVQSDSIHGVQYAIPWVATVRALGYNRRAFAKARIAAPPAMWAQFVADARRAEKSGYIGYCLPLGAEDAQAEWSLWMWSNGGGWTDAAGRWTIDSPQNLQTLQFLRELADRYKVTEADPGTTDRTNGCWADFAEGHVAMTGIVLPSMFATSMKGSSVRWGAAPWPRSSLSVPPFTLAEQDVLMAFKKPGNTASVKDFLDFVYQPGNYRTFVQNEGFLPTTRSVSRAMAANPVDSEGIKLLPTARFYPVAKPSWNEVQSAVQSQLGTALDPRADPARVLSTLQQNAQSAG